MFQETDILICQRCGISYMECDCEDDVRYTVYPKDSPGTCYYVANGEYDGSDFDECSYWDM